MAESSLFNFTQSQTPTSGTQFSFGSVREDCSCRCHRRGLGNVKRKSHLRFTAIKSADFVISEDNWVNKFEDQKNSLAADGGGGIGLIFNTGMEKDSMFNHQETTRKEFNVEEPQTEKAEKENKLALQQNGTCIPLENKKTGMTGETNPDPASHSSLSVTIISRILKGIPQNPHFYHLYSYTEVTRKQLIAGWDRIFEEIVDQIHCLKPANFQGKVQETWKALEELQSLGYNVIPLRRRVLDLSDVMKELKLNQREVKGLKIKAENHRTEKCRLESIIINLQAMTMAEEKCMVRVMAAVAEMERDLPKFEGVFSKLAMEPI